MLTALGERDAAIRDGGAPGGAATMTDDEGLSVREAVEWCGTGVTVREVTRLRHLAQDPLAATDECATDSAAGLAELRDGGRPSGGQHHDQQEGHVEDPVHQMDGAARAP